MLCGDNSGQHMYVDVRGRSETNLNILSMPVFPKPVGVHNETNSSRWPESASTVYNCRSYKSKIFGPGP